MRIIEILIGLPIVGAIGTALVMFLKQAYELISNGVPRDRVPIDQLLIEVMQLDQFAIYGAIGGAVLAVVVLIWQAISDMMVRRATRKTNNTNDPHAIIQAHREQIADDYLASRAQEASS